MKLDGHIVLPRLNAPGRFHGCAEWNLSNHWILLVRPAGERSQLHFQLSYPSTSPTDFTVKGPIKQPEWSREQLKAVSEYLSRDQHSLPNLADNPLEQTISLINIQARYEGVCDPMLIRHRPSGVNYTLRVDPMLGGFIPSVAVDLLFMLLIVLPTLTLIIYRWHRRLFKWLDQGLEDERKRQ